MVYWRCDYCKYRVTSRDTVQLMQHICPDCGSELRTVQERGDRNYKMR